MRKIRCVSYVDHYSINASSLEDLKLGHEHSTVGCNSDVFGASDKGDLVIITATSKKKKKYFTIGVLEKKLDSCQLWKEHGGKLWKHNFKYIPLVKEIFELTVEIKKFITECCQEEDLKEQYLFHSRFCGKRYGNTVDKLVSYLNKNS